MFYHVNLITFLITNVYCNDKLRIVLDCFCAIFVVTHQVCGDISVIGNLLFAKVWFCNAYRLVMKNFCVSVKLNKEMVS